MASAVPYNSEGFGTEANPFAQDPAPSNETSTESTSPDTQEPSAAETRTEPEETPAPPPAEAPAKAPAAAAPVPAAELPAKPVKKYKLVLKITDLERNGKKDPIFRFDAYVRFLVYFSRYFTNLKKRLHYHDIERRHSRTCEEHIMSFLSLELI